MTARERAKKCVDDWNYGPENIEDFQALALYVEAAILAGQSDERERCAREVEAESSKWGALKPTGAIAARHIRALPPEDVKR